MAKPKRGRVQGPLAPYAAAFWEELAGCSYAVRSAEAHLLLMARLSRWLEQTRLDPGELGSAQVDEFLCWNHAEGYRFPKSARGAMPLLVFLRGRVEDKEAKTFALGESIKRRPAHHAR